MAIVEALFALEKLNMLMPSSSMLYAF